MSNLRIFGIIIGIIGLCLSFIVFREKKWNRLNFILFAFFSLALLGVSINPDILNILQRLLSLDKAQRGRIIALLICSNIFLWFLVLYFGETLARQKIQFDKLIRAIGIEGLHADLKQNLPDTNVAMLIPAYNEADNLRELLPEIPHETCGNKISVLVIDDGSGDLTYNTAIEAGVFSVRN